MASTSAETRWLSCYFFCLYMFSFLPRCIKSVITTYPEQTPFLEPHLIMVIALCQQRGSYQVIMCWTKRLINLVHTLAEKHDQKNSNVISLIFGQLKTATSTICSSGLLESSAERRSSLFFSFGIAQFIQILQVGNLVNVHLVFLLGAQHENNKYPLITSHPQIKAASHKGW